MPDPIPAADPQPVPDNPDPVEEPAEDKTPQPNLVDVNQRDDKNQQLWFHRKHVVDLRKENKDLRQELTEVKSQFEQIQQEKELARIQDLQERQEWKTLYEEKERQLAQRDQQVQRERLNTMRVQIGTDMGLPVELAKRLDGVNEEEIRQDAERILQYWITPDEEQPAPARPTTTSAVPGGEPPSRNNEDRRKEFYSHRNESPMFQGGSEVKINVKDKGPFGG